MVKTAMIHLIKYILIKISTSFDPNHGKIMKQNPDDIDINNLDSDSHMFCFYCFNKLLSDIDILKYFQMELNNNKNPKPDPEPPDKPQCPKCLKYFSKWANVQRHLETVVCQPSKKIKMDTEGELQPVVMENEQEPLYLNVHDETTEAWIRI